MGIFEIFANNDVREGLKELKKYNLQGWSNPDKKNMLRKIDKIFGENLI